ncbi:MAG: Lon protease family protein [Promethearchaeota archaeon]
MSSFKVPIEKLRRECKTDLMSCSTTEELDALEGIIGQERAVKALKFGLSIHHKGFNIYVTGIPGIGKKTAIKSYLDEIAKEKPPSPDWCYVYNFKDPYRPLALKFEAGQAKIFQKDIDDLINEVSQLLLGALDSQDYQNEKEQVIKEFEQRRRVLTSEFEAEAKEKGFLVQYGPMGVSFVPIMEGKPLTEQELLNIPIETRNELDEKAQELRARLRIVMREVRDIEKELQKRLSNLDQEVAKYTLGVPLGELKEKYKVHKEVLEYLEDLKNDIIEDLDLFRRQRPERGPPQSQDPRQAAIMAARDEASSRKYKVNLFVDNSNLKGAPVIIQQNPIPPKLWGRIEKEARFGTLTTDHTLLQCGSLHYANGGFLVLPIEAVLLGGSYEGLKRALLTQEIVIEDIMQQLGFLSAKGLSPMPIPISELKVILVGHPILFSQLQALDPEFSELWKVKAEFGMDWERNAENEEKYASFVCKVCSEENLMHLDEAAVQKLVEYSSRIADSQNKLSTHFRAIADIIREANYYALEEKAEHIWAKHIQQAIEEKEYRSSMIKDQLLEQNKNGTILLQTDGENIGVVNGLAVLSLGDYAFGRPSRVTASVALGREGIIDVQREAQMGGPTHTKGVLILTGYLNETFGRKFPVSLSARLVFEQSYGLVDGDSASSTELYALLSELSGVPIKQNIAVTGSVNQKGEVQPIGGVNQKIEGFFEACKINGLTGKQGVMIPESNIQHLMLKEEVLDAVKAGKFHIWSVKTINEGIEVLTGEKAGELKEDGTFEEGTINYKVAKRLEEMANNIREYYYPPR